jgi:hypothetical protein
MSAEIPPLYRKAFILSGKAKVTLVSKETRTRFTYQVIGKELSDGRTLHFVSLLRGPDNQQDYAYIGTVFDGTEFRHTQKSVVTCEAPSFQAFGWTLNHLDSDQIEVWHSGTCGRCGRELTDPESIQRGLGPVCAGK